MIDTLLEQLSWDPLVRRPLAQIPHPLVIGGMGGSALAGEALAFLLPDRPVLVHRDYGVPTFAPDQAFYIAVSYSGNTEETLSFANEAYRRGERLAIVASGGALADFAEREQLPLVLVPSGIQPRCALIYLSKALLALTGEEQRAAGFAHMRIDTAALQEEAEQDAHFMLQSVPLFYASKRNAVLATIGKVLINETARTPAFANVFPELNHNEMQAYDRDMPEGLEHLFRFVLVRDSADGERIVGRVDALRHLMEERGRLVRVLDISVLKRDEALVHVWMRFVIASRFLAETRGIKSDQVPLIEAFKKLI